MEDFLTIIFCVGFVTALTVIIKAISRKPTRKQDRWFGDQFYRDAGASLDTIVRDELPKSFFNLLEGNSVRW